MAQVDRWGLAGYLLEVPPREPDRGRAISLAPGNSV
jgi:hypothetical protein